MGSNQTISRFYALNKYSLYNFNYFYETTNFKEISYCTTKCRRAGVIKQINHNHELIKKIYQLFLAYC